MINEVGISGDPFDGGALVFLPRRGGDTNAWQDHHFANS